MIAGVVALWMAAAQVQVNPWPVETVDLLSGYEQGIGDGWRTVRITSREQWEARREDIIRRVLDIMGPSPRPGTPLSPATLAVTDEGSYTRSKVIYRDDAGKAIPAWLLTPKRRGRFPAVLAAHPTAPGGKDPVVGVVKPEYFYGRELAARGFVVLAPDSITAGERVAPGAKPYSTEAFDKAHPEWSAMGKMLADHRRGIDYLASLPMVDAARIGAIGHSLGGYNAYFLAAFDSRVRAAVSSCGYTPLGRASRAFAWARNAGFVHFPRLAPYLRAGIVPFEFTEVLALPAPRALFTYSAADDVFFPDAAAVRAGATQVAEIYRILGAPDRFIFRMGEGPHAFPEPVRQAAYDWLAVQLGR